MAHRNQYLVTLSGLTTLNMPTGGPSGKIMHFPTKEDFDKDPKVQKKKYDDEETIFEKCKLFLKKARTQLESSEVKDKANIIYTIFMSFDINIEQQCGINSQRTPDRVDAILRNTHEFKTLQKQYKFYQRKWRDNKPKTLCQIIIEKNKQEEEKKVFESAMEFYEVVRKELSDETIKACGDETKRKIGSFESTVEKGEFVAWVIEGIFISIDSKLEYEWPELWRYVKPVLEGLNQDKTMLDMTEKYSRYRTTWKNDQPKTLVDIVFEGLCSS